MAQIIGTNSIFANEYLDARRNKSDYSYHGPEQLMAEKKQLESDMQTMQISFHNLHQRYEDMKQLYEQLKLVHY